MSGSAVARQISRFGVFELDPESGELRKAGTRVHLQEQPSKILAILLENAGRVVTREELRDAIWPADTFVDFDHGLNTAIRKLRIALDDDAESPRFVETVARRGYRFLVPVERPVATPPPEAIAGKIVGESAKENKGATNSRLLLFTRILLAIAVIAAISVLFLRRTARVAPSKEETIRRIAVLPIVNVDDATAYVSDGLTLGLIQSLSSSAALRVTAPTSSFRYRRSTAAPPVIGRELGVSSILTGILRGQKSEYHLHLELVDARDGAQLWGKDYAYRAPDLELLRRRIAADVAFRLGVDRGDDTKRVHSAEAYDLYLRGRYLWSRRSRQNLLRSIEYFEKALEIDPDFALAWAGLGNSYGAITGNRLFPGSEEEFQRKADAATAKALALDDTLVEAWASRAAGKHSYHHDFDGAKGDFERAIALSPSYASAHQWYSTLLRNTGRQEEARREIDLAYQLDPFSVPVAMFVCWDRLYSRDYGEAIQFAGHVREADPTMNLYGCVHWCHILSGNYEAAIESVKAQAPAEASAMANALRNGGVEAFWRTRLDQVADDHYVRAVMYGFLGDRDRAFAELDEAFNSRQSDIPAMYVDPRMDPLRPDPRFDALAGRIGLPQVTRKAKR